MGLPTRRSVALLTATLALTLACADRGPDRTPAAIRVVGTSSVQLEVGQSANFSVECLNKSGQVIHRANPSWLVGESLNGAERPGRIALEYQRGNAHLRGISAGPLRIAVGCLPILDLWISTFGRTMPGGYDARLTLVSVQVLEPADSAWTLEPATDSLRLRLPSAEDSSTGTSRLLSVRSGLPPLAVRDPSEFTWSVDHPEVASVSADGLVRAAGLGVTVLRVGRDERELTLPLRVDSGPPTQAWDIALVDAHWTQGAQDAEQRVPIISNGRAAAVNVTAFATPGAPDATVTLQVWDAAGVLVHSANAPLQPTTDSAPSFATPSAQFLVPRSVLRHAVRWRVVRDGVLGGDAAAVPDADASNDALPRTGTETLRSYWAPPLRLRLVPLRLAEHGNAMTEITVEDRVYYDSIARIRLPIADVEVRIESPLTVQGRLPTIAELEDEFVPNEWYWTTYMPWLEAVDARRLASGAGREDYWLGVFPRPTPDASGYAGLAYIPVRPSETGPMSRSMIARSHDWQSEPVRTGFTVAHELAHSLGLQHAPSCNAPGPDLAYPVDSGGVGEWVHWVSTWEHGDASQAVTIPPESGDLMGGCSSSFLGPYHTRLILEWREMADAFLVAPVVPTRVLALRGLLTDNQILVRAPRILDAEPISGEGEALTVELLAGDGRVLVRTTARLGRLSESSDIPFVAHIPLEPAWEAELTSVRVRSAVLGREVSVRFTQ